jgi:hypothetical protein
MRKEIGRRLRDVFSRRLQESLPQLKPLKDSRLTPGNRLFHWPVAENLVFFVYLQMHQLWDTFYIELGWSDKDLWPGHLIPGRPTDPGEGVGFRERLEYIIDKKARRSCGWDVVPWPALDNPLGYINLPPVESTFDRVDELVDFIVGHIAEEGMEFFRLVAAERGCELTG